MCGSCDVRELVCEGVAVWGSCGVGELHCGVVAVWGSCGVGQLQCGGVAVCEGPSGYHTLNHCI